MNPPDDDLQFDLDLCLDQDEDTPAPALARVGRDEMNLAEFPFALLADRVPAGMSTVRFEDEVEGKDGKLVTRVWTVTGSESFGLPLASDEQVYVALMEVSKEQGFGQRSIFVTRYDLIKRLGWPDKGDSYRRLRAALDRLLGVTIKAEKAFWDKTKQRYVDVGFHIIDEYALYDETPGRKSAGKQEALPLSFVTWNQVIFRSMQAGNIKQLDTAFFFSLRHNVSRRLFRYLDKKRYDGKPNYRIRLKKLAFEKLGMSRSYYPSQIKRELERAHEELGSLGFLADVRYEKTAGNPDEMVVYSFTRRKHRVTSEPPSPDHARELAEMLAEVGVTPSVARKLVEQFGDEARIQLQYLPYRGAQDPAAVIVEAIKGSWEPPASYLRARRDQAQREATDRRLAEMNLAREAEQTRAEHAQRAAARTFDSLAIGVQREITERATARVGEISPPLAQRPESRAFGAMVQQQIAEIIRDEYPEEYRRELTRIESAAMDLNDDL